MLRCVKHQLVKDLGRINSCVGIFYTVLNLVFIRSLLLYTLKGALVLILEDIKKEKKLQKENKEENNKHKIPGNQF